MLRFGQPSILPSSSLLRLPTLSRGLKSVLVGRDKNIPANMDTEFKFFMIFPAILIAIGIYSVIKRCQQSRKFKLSLNQAYPSES